MGKKDLTVMKGKKKPIPAKSEFQKALGKTKKKKKKGKRWQGGF